MGFYFPLFYPHSSGNTGKSRMRSWRRDKEEIIWETNKRREEGRKKKVPRFRKREKITRDKARKERKRKKEKRKEEKSKKPADDHAQVDFPLSFFPGNLILAKLGLTMRFFSSFWVSKQRKKENARQENVFPLSYGVNSR